MKISYSGTGNRCGHIPNLPKDATFPAEHKRPVVIQKLMQAARKYYHAPRSYLTHLLELNTGSVKTKRHRQTRSDGREAIALIAQVIAYNLELSTMTVCANDINFLPLPLEKLAKQGGISLSRGCRAIGKLVRAGYLLVTRQFVNARNTYEALASIKEVMPKFFADLGLASDYAFQKHYKDKKMQLKQHRNKKKFQNRPSHAAGLLASMSPGFCGKEASERIRSRKEGEKILKNLYLKYAEKKPEAAEGCKFMIDQIYKISLEGIEAKVKSYRAILAELENTS
jgi:IncFII RepA protein family.